MGSTFGKFDKNATHDVLDGEDVDAGTPGAQTLPDPNGGLDDSQIRNRRIARAGLNFIAGAAKQKQPQATPRGQSVAINFADQQPSFQPPAPPNITPPFFGKY
jgi:hypothetical protein